jgi:hypothetical protein
VRSVLLLTSTVAPPPGVPFLHVTDPEERRRQYEAAVTAWTRVTESSGVRLLIVDSSPEVTDSLRAFQDTVQNMNTITRIVELAHEPAAADQHRDGKGIGEAHILRKAMAHIRPEESDLVKCTGRLVVRQPRALFPSHRDGIMCLLSPALDWADSRLFAAPVAVVQKYFLHLDESIDEKSGVFFEHVFARVILSAVGDGIPFRPWPRIPQLTGVAGSTGRRYDTLGSRLRATIQDRLRTHVMTHVPL